MPVSTTPLSFTIREEETMITSSKDLECEVIRVGVKCNSEQTSNITFAPNSLDFKKIAV